MDQSQIQQQLLADTPLDKLQLSFTETCELLLQQNADILKDLDEGFSQDGVQMKSAKRLHLKADDQALHITLDLVTPKDPFYGQQTYLLFSVQDALTNIKQLLVQHDKEYYRQVYNEATDNQTDAPEKIVDEPANKRIMISAVMRLNSVEPVHEDMMMLQLPHITVPPVTDTAAHTSSSASATKKHGKDHRDDSHDNTDAPMARVLEVELPEPSAVMGESYGHQASDASLHDLPQQTERFSMPADLPIEPPQPVNVPPAFANPPQYPQPMPQPQAPVPQAPVPQAMPMPQAPAYQPPPPMPAPPRQSNDMYQPPPQTISPTVPQQPTYGPPQMPQQPYGNPMQQPMQPPMQPPMPPQQGQPANQQRGGFYQLPQ